MRKAQDVVDFFESWDVDHARRMYLRSHSPRYVFLLSVVEGIVEKIRDTSDSPPTVLNIGPAWETELLRQDPGVVVNTLGLGLGHVRLKPRPFERHFSFNLNDSQYQEGWPKIEEHDVVVMAEVIEHLHTSPKLVLQCVGTWVKKGGYLIVQTPNAVSLSKRLRMLSGKHPYHMIRQSRTNPGHFREYTLDELVSIAREAGFDLTDYTVRNYFAHAGMVGAAYDLLCRLLPARFRDGITVCLRRS